MTPQYNPDPSQVSAFFHIFPKGDYLFDVGEGKPFEGTNAEGNANAGVRYPLTCSRVIEGDAQAVKKKQMFTCYVHSDGAISFSKRFQMGCLGFNGDSEGEQKFNEEMAGADWRIDPDPTAPYLGDAWKRIGNTSVIISCDVKMDDEGKRQQNWGAFSPLSSL
jgi:hypothetical protein